jgi:hypothetical protein
MFEPLGPSHLFTHKISYKNTYVFIFELQIGIQATTSCCLGPLDGNPFNGGISMGIPLTVGFRPQLVVVSGLLVGIPLTVGFSPQLVVVSDLLVGIPLTVGYRLSRSLRLSRSRFHDTFLPLLNSRLSWSLFHKLFSCWNLGYHEASFMHFSFTQWNFGYQEAFHELFFHTMEFRLSRSLS